MTDLHFANFIAGIRKGEKLNAPISVGNVAVTMLSYLTSRGKLTANCSSTRKTAIQGDTEAMKSGGAVREGLGTAYLSCLGAMPGDYSATSKDTCQKAPFPEES